MKFFNFSKSLLITYGILFLSIIFTINSYAKKVEFYSYSPEWVINGYSKKLFDTPLGMVVKLCTTKMPLNAGINENNVPYGYSQKVNNEIRKTAIYPLAFNFTKKSSDDKKLKSFIVIDFKMRLYPAIEKGSDNILGGLFIVSNKRAETLKQHRHIKMFGPFGRSGIPGFLDYQELLSCPLDNHTYCRHFKEARSIFRNNIQPYEINSFRFVFDRRNGFKKFYSFSINGQVCGYPMNSVKAIRSFAFLAMSSRNIIEVSKPKFFTTDDEEEILKLPKIKLSSPYPYSAYINGEFLKNNKKRNYSKIKRLNNPDEIYAYAMHFLKGSDIPTGIKLLQHIAKKERHIFAMRELGICYLKGIGVPKNNKLARKWLSKAAKDYRDINAAPYYNTAYLNSITKPHVTYLVAKKKLIIYPLTNSFSGTSRHGLSMIRHRTVARSMIDPFSVVAHDKLKYRLTVNNGKCFYLRKDVDIPSKEEFYETFKNSLLMFGLPNVSGDFNTVELPAHYFYRGQFMVRRWAQEIRKINKKKFDNPKEKEREINKVNIALNKAMGTFRSGFEINNDTDCALEVLQCQVRLKKLKKEDFDRKMFYSYSHHPLFYLLRNAVVAPTYPGMQDFLNCNYDIAMAKLEKIKTSKSMFLKAAIGIYIFHHVDKMYYYQKILSDPPNIGLIVKAYKALDFAVNKNNVDAMYLKALLIKDNKYNTRADEFFVGSDKALLKRAAKKKHPMAIYQLMDSSFKSSVFNANPKYIKQLKPLRNAKHANAWLLTGDLLVKLRGISLKTRDPIIRVYKKAAEYGSHEALHKIAMIYYNSGKENMIAMSTQYWKKYIKAINKQRKYDENDFYHEDPYQLKGCSIYEDMSAIEDQLGNDEGKVLLHQTFKEFGFKRGEDKLYLKMLSSHYNFLNNIVVFDENKNVLSATRKKGKDILKRLFINHNIDIPSYIEEKETVFNEQ